VGFFALAYLASWGCFLAAGVASGSGALRHPVLASARDPLFLAGAFGPGAVALALTARDEGRSGLSALLARVVQWRVPVRWYLFAVSYLAGIKLAAAVIHRLLLGAWPRFGTDPWYAIVIVTVTSTIFQAGEELGWRGYALPRIAEHVGLARASVVVGLLWAGWHLPLFFVAGVDKFGQSFPLYLLQVTALSVAIAWLYGHTDGSLLLSMLMHSAGNQSVGIVPSAVPGARDVFGFQASPIGWLTVTLLWIGAAFFLFRMPRGWIPSRFVTEDRT
jgi:CAAX protease family protein